MTKYEKIDKYNNLIEEQLNEFIKEKIKREKEKEEREEKEKKEEKKTNFFSDLIEKISNDFENFVKEKTENFYSEQKESAKKSFENLKKLKLEDLEDNEDISKEEMSILEIIKTSDNYEEFCKKAKETISEEDFSKAIKNIEKRTEKEEEEIEKIFKRIVDRVILKEKIDKKVHDELTIALENVKKEFPDNFDYKLHNRQISISLQID